MVFPWKPPFYQRVKGHLSIFLDWFANTRQEHPIFFGDELMKPKKKITKNPIWVCLKMLAKPQKNQWCCWSLSLWKMASYHWEYLPNIFSYQPIWSMKKYWFSAYPLSIFQHLAVAPKKTKTFFEPTTDARQLGSTFTGRCNLAHDLLQKYAMELWLIYG